MKTTIWRKPSRVDVFGKDQNHLIETYSEDGIRRGFTDVDHLGSEDVMGLLENADAAVIRDPSKVSGNLLADLEITSYSASRNFGYRGLFLGDEDLVEEEILYEDEGFETDGGLLMR